MNKDKKITKSCLPIWYLQGKQNKTNFAFTYYAKKAHKDSQNHWLSGNWKLKLLWETNTHIVKINIDWQCRCFNDVGQGDSHIILVGV